MQPRYPINSTSAMLKSIGEFNASRTTILRILRGQLADAREAVVKLPAKNEQGESVLHGCNKDMYALIEFYEHTIHDLLRLDGQDRLVENGGLALATDGKWAL